MPIELNAWRHIVVLLLAVCLAEVPVASAQNIETRRVFSRDMISRAVAATTRDPQTPATPRDDSGWAEVTRLKVNTDTRVVLNDKSVHHGAWRGADSASITLLIGAGERRILRAEVRQVSTRGTDRARRAQTGAVLGMLTGIGLGVLSCRGEGSECLQGAPLSGLVLGLIGGAIVGAAWSPWRQVYDTKP